ncbi:BAI1-associated protein 3-like isoform X1 [Limulus polyphemus]|uniref:BAI1-associated protein 3-like isoform X1 n=1 Tax=Limulus polyphemus TaxID=6850 RepID=A0ABM1TA82_LIMPO|nr:BAI1-associated protein 3-like isoform X1 [Limulus polyphemus]
MRRLSRSFGIQDDGGARPKVKTSEANEFLAVSGQPLLTALDEELTEDQLTQLYIQSCFAAQNYLGTSSKVYSSTTQEIISFMQDLFWKLPPEKQQELQSQATRMKENPIQLIVKVLEAKELPSNDASGLCDPYCRLWINKKQSRTTEVKEQNRNPVWRETFTLDISNAQKDVLHVDIWDRDPRSIKGALAEWKYVKGVRSCLRFFKDLAENVLLRKAKYIDDYMGGFRKPIQIIPSVGLDVHFDLRSKTEKEPGLPSSHGTMHVQLHFKVKLPEHTDHVVALQNHLRLVKLCFENSFLRKKTENVSLWFEWTQVLPPPSRTLLLQHKLQQGLTAEEMIICRWMALSKLILKRRITVSCALLFTMLEEIKQIRTRDDDWQISEELSQAYTSMMASFTNYLCSQLRHFHGLFDLSDQTSTFELISLLHCLITLEQIVDISVIDQAEEALQAEASDWHMAVVHSQLLTSQSITAERLKEIVATYRENHQRANTIFSNDRESLELDNVPNWFGHEAIEKWFIWAEENALVWISGLIELDEMEPVNDELKFGRSARDTMDIVHHKLVDLWQSLEWPNIDCTVSLVKVLHNCFIHFAREMEKKIAAHGYFDTEGVFEIQIKFCVSVTSMTSVVTYIEGVKSNIVLNLEQAGQTSVQIAEICQPLDSASDFILNVVRSVFAGVVLKMRPELQRLLGQIGKATNEAQQHRAVFELSDYIDETLHSMNLFLDTVAFHNLARQIWGAVIITMKDETEDILQEQICCRRKRPLKIKGFITALKQMEQIFHGDGKGLSVNEITNTRHYKDLSEDLTNFLLLSGETGDS